MTVVLALITALIAIPLVAELLPGADPEPRLSLGPLPVDDAYTAWFNANLRCGEALQVWLDAGPEARPHAYRAYLAELEREEAAAAELELHAVAPAA
jgi:hypothetical protein